MPTQPCGLSQCASTPGQYRAAVAPQIAGEWKAKLTLAALPAPVEATFLVTVK